MIAILYGGKLWRWEMLANLANDRGFAKFIPAQLKKVSRDKIHLRYYIGIRQYRFSSTLTVHLRLYKTKHCLSLPVV